LNIKKIFGMSIGLIGSLPIILAKSTSIKSITFSSAEFVMFVAVFSGAYAWFLVKELLSKGYSLLLINGITMSLGSLITIANLLIIDGPKGLQVQSFWPFLGYSSALIFIGNIFAYNLYGILLRRYSITFILLAEFMSPLYGLLYGWIFFNDAISTRDILSFAIIIIGVYIFHHGEVG
jgi:drug/metabolite transporter (DMT)-like permease